MKPKTKKILYLFILLSIVTSGFVLISSKGIPSLSKANSQNSNTISSIQPFLAMGREGRQHWRGYDRDDCRDCDQGNMGMSDSKHHDYMMNESERIPEIAYELHNFRQGLQDVASQLNERKWIIPGIIFFALISVIMGISLLSLFLILPILVIFILFKMVQSLARNEMKKSETETASEVVRSESDTIGKYVYYIYLISIGLPVISLIGVIISYIYRDGASDWMKSHYQYQIRSFWIAILFCTINAILSLVLIGILGYIFMIFWVIARTIKGLRWYNQSQPVPNPKVWLW